MARSNWNDVSPDYVEEVINQVIELLGFQDKPKQIAFLHSLAKYSNSDSIFLRKVRVLYGLSPKKVQVKSEVTVNQEKPKIIFKEVNDGKQDAVLSPVFEKRLDELRKDD